jgi:hypothetical protein
MRLEWPGVWKSCATTCAVFAALFVTWLLFGLVPPEEESVWPWGWIILACGGIAGFWGAWRNTSLLEAMVGAVLFVFTVFLALLAFEASDPIVPLTDMASGLVYKSLGCALTATIGYYVGRFVFRRTRQQEPEDNHLIL